MRYQKLYLIVFSLLLFTLKTTAAQPFSLSCHLGDITLDVKADLKDKVDGDSLRFYLQQRFFKTMELYATYGPYSWVHRFNGEPVPFYGEPKQVFDHCYRLFAASKGSFDPSKYEASKFWQNKPQGYHLTQSDSAELDQIRKRNIFSGFVEFDQLDTSENGQIEKVHYIATEDFHFSIAYEEVMTGIIASIFDTILQPSCKGFNVHCGSVYVSRGTMTQMVPMPSLKAFMTSLSNGCMAYNSLPSNAAIEGRTGYRYKSDVCHILLSGQDALSCLAYANAAITKTSKDIDIFLQYHPDITLVKREDCIPDRE